MRLLLIVLITLNLLYAGWEYLSPVATGNTPPPLAENLNKLELLHEIRLDHRADLSSQPRLEEEDSVEVQDENSEDVLSSEPDGIACYTLGPFKDKNIMQQLRDSLAEHVVNIAVRKRQQLEKHRYWVYMPALPNRKQAKKMATKLRESGVNDFYIVLSGSKKNSISLGHFREPNHANRRVKTVVGQGFDAEIEVIYREYDIYWLDYEINKAESSVEFSMDEYITEGVSRLDRECTAAL